MASCPLTLNGASSSYASRNVLFPLASANGVTPILRNAHRARHLGLHVRSQPSDASAEVHSPDATAPCDLVTGSPEVHGSAPGTESAVQGTAASGTKKRPGNSKAASTTTSNEPPAASEKTSSRRRARGQAGPAAIDSPDTSASSAADASTSSPATPAPSDASPSSAAAAITGPAQSRVQAIRSRLLASMRSATRYPIAASISLMLEPVKQQQQQAGREAAGGGPEGAGAAPSSAPGGGKDGSFILRADPLPPAPIRPGRLAAARAQKQAPDAVGDSNTRRRTAEVEPVRGRPGSRLEEVALERRGSRTAGEVREPRQGRTAGLRDRDARDEAAGEVTREAGAQQRPTGRVLKTRAARLAERAEEKTGVAARREAQAAEASWRGPAGREAARGRDVLREAPGREADRREVVYDDRQTRVRRSNEEFARYMEGMAASVTAAAAASGDRGGRSEATSRGQGDDTVRQPKLQQQHQQIGALRAHARQNQQEEEEAERRRRQAEVEQADLLRGLADMFRNFARQAQRPAAAAAAVVGAIGSAAAAKATTAATAGSDSGASPARDFPFSFFPRGGSGDGRRANDIKLILEPLSSLERLSKLPDDAGGQAEGLNDVAAAGASARTGRKRVLRARPLPTRSDLLRVMKPMPLTRLPVSLGGGVRGSLQERRRWMQSLEADMGSAEAAGLAAGGAGLSPAVWRLMRRRSYYFRVVAPRIRQAQEQWWEPGQAQEVKPDEEPEGWRGVQDAGADVKGGLPLAAGGEGVADEAGAAQQGTREEQSQTPPTQPRYELSGRSFRVKRKLQFTDRLKHVVRKARLSRDAVAASQPHSPERDEQQANAAAAGAEKGPRDDGGEGEEEEEEPRGEYNSAAEVVNDVYEQIMGVRLPERAMYGRRAEVLAAMSPQIVKEQSRAWIEACGKEYALAFHAREPLLLSQPPQSLLVTLEALSRVLALPPEGCVQLALRSPQLVGLPGEQLQGAVEAVSEALEIGMKEAGRIVARHPVLAVRQPLFPVAQRVEMLGVLLPVSRDKLRQVLRQRPLLLCKSLQNLARFMMGASITLGLPLFDVALMIAGAPGMTGISSSRLAARWGALQRLAASHPPWQEQLAATSPPGLGRCLVASEAAVQRLEVLVDRGLAAFPEFSRFKRALTMSAARYQAAVEAAAAGAAATAAAAAKSQEGEEGQQRELENQERQDGERVGAGAEDQGGSGGDGHVDRSGAQPAEPQAAAAQVGTQ